MSLASGSLAMVAQPDMRHLDGDRHPVDQHDLVRPVELVRLAGRKAQRYIGFCRRGAALGAPPLGVPTKRVVAALINTARWAVGVYLGQSQDPTAIAVLAKIDRPSQSDIKDPAFAREGVSA